MTFREILDIELTHTLSRWQMAQMKFVTNRLHPEMMVVFKQGTGAGFCAQSNLFQRPPNLTIAVLNLRLLLLREFSPHVIYGRSLW